MSTEAVPSPAPAPAKSRFGWIKKLFLLFAIVLITLIVVIMMQPPDYRVTRSETMNAPADSVFEQVNDFHNWEKWSPWAKLDPNMKVTFDGPPSGVGAKYSWTGNEDVGEGRMTILESKPNERVVIKLEFIKPFPSESTTEFTLQESSPNTTVTWTMSGQNNFLSKAFQLFMNMDAMIGKDFEKGLASMKTVVEKK